jgi:hypothetical protein
VRIIVILPSLVNNKFEFFMRFLKGLLVSALALLMLAMLAIYLTPLDAYVPEVEQTLSGQLHEPVSIRQISFAALPLPHLKLQDVRLGKKEVIVARAVDVDLDLRSLLAGQVVVRQIAVRDGSAHLVPLRKLIELFASPSVATQGVAVRELQLFGMSLLAPGMTLGPIEGKLEFAQGGKLQRAWFAMDEQKATATLVPLANGRFVVQLLARNWTAPKLQQWPFDRLQLEGVLGKQDFVAQKFAAVTRGISVAGSGKAEFSDGWQIKAELTQADISLEQAMALLGNQAELTGALSAKGLLSAKANTLGELKDNFLFDGEVQANHVTTRIAAGFRQPFVFDEIRARVDAEPDYLMLSGIQARLYGGKLSGEVSINRKDALVEGDIAASSITMNHLVEALTNEVLFTGTMDSAAKFSIRTVGDDELPANLRLTGDFHLRNGTLTKVDLLQAASSPGTIASKGGATRFDDLTGLFKVDEAGYHFRRVKISSGSLNAEGRVDIAPSLQLSGTLDADVRGTGGLVSMPMNVSGTLNDPVVRPSGTALAGAAVGTAFLGPGLGTAVGIKVGGFLTKLFGKNEDKNKEASAAPVAPARK